MITEDDIRLIALSLPSTTEKPSYGTPGFRVDDTLFARIREEGDLLISVADVGEKRVLLESEPDKFFTTAHYDGYASVLVRFSAVDVDELAELLTEAWRVRAPARCSKRSTPSPTDSSGRHDAVRAHTVLAHTVLAHG